MEALVRGRDILRAKRRYIDGLVEDSVISSALVMEISHKVALSHVYV